MLIFCPFTLFFTFIESVEVITLNCQGLQSSDSRDTLFSWLNCCGVDFLCLQETHSTSSKEFSRWLRSAIDSKLLSSAYSCISSPGTNRSSGVAIVFKSQHVLTSSLSDQQGRFVCGQFTVADQTFSLCNVYGPNTAREGALFFESLYPVLDPDLPSIVCGDFNTVVDPHLDRRGCNISSPWTYNWSSTLTTFMSTFSLFDAWRRLHPNAEGYTYVYCLFLYLGVVLVVLVFGS